MTARVVAILVLLGLCAYLVWDIFLYRDGVPRNTISEVGTYWVWRVRLLAWVGFGLLAHITAGGLLPYVRPEIGVPALVVLSLVMLGVTLRLPLHPLTHPLLVGVAAIPAWGILWQVPKSAAGLG